MSELRDPRLHQLVNEADVVCVELMDVLVERRVLRPGDVVRFSQECFNVRSGRYLAMEVAPHRAKAERDLREEATAAGRSPESVGLLAIYERIAELTDLDPVTVDLLTQAELEAERHLIRTRQQVLEPIIHAAEQGKMVVVVDDTHLPRSFVEELLDMLGVPTPIDLQLSSDTGVTLSDGTGWSVLCHRYAECQIAYVGATPAAVEAAASHGVEVAVVVPSSEAFRDQVGPAAALNGPMVFAHLAIDGWRLKNIHRSMVSALAAARAAVGDNPSAVTMVGYGALGPLVVGFVQWLHREATRGKTECLVFEGDGGRFLEAAYRLLWPDSTLGGRLDPAGGAMVDDAHIAGSEGQRCVVSSGWDPASGRWTPSVPAGGTNDSTPLRLTFGRAPGQELVTLTEGARAFVDAGSPVLAALAGDLLSVSPGLLQSALSGTPGQPEVERTALIEEVRTAALEFVTDFADLVEGLPSTLAVIDHPTACEPMVMLLNFPTPAAVSVLEQFRRAAGL